MESTGIVQLANQAITAGCIGRPNGQTVQVQSLQIVQHVMQLGAQFALILGAGDIRQTSLPKQITIRRRQEKIELHELVWILLINPYARNTLNFRRETCPRFLIQPTSLCTLGEQPG